VTESIISVTGLGIQFKRNRRHRRSFKDLFAESSRRAKPDEFWALRDVNFSVAPGEAVGVVGRNGQGKSTLLKLVADVMIADEGRVEVSGGVAPLIEITGGFIDDLSVRENVYLTAGLHGMSVAEIDDQFDEMISFADIGDFLDTPYKHLSSGMRIRIAFAVITRLDELLASGRTLFFVSHSEPELLRFCTRGLYLDKGKLILDGSIQEVVDRYNADYK
jgi:ABC-2 type transport system ATP-binding protein